MTRTTLVPFLLILAGFSAAGAQRPGIFYPEPPVSAIAVSKDVAFASVDTLTLRMDVYRPARTAVRSPRPALVFYLGGVERTSAAYVAWARLAASKGLVAVLADARGAEHAKDFSTLLAHLTERGTTYGLDTAAITAFGASSNSANLLRFAQDPRERRIKAAVHYYGGETAIMQFRRDLPVLYVRAGIDRPFVNASIDTAVVRALAQNVPITIINHAGGHHGFEYTDDDVVTRELIDQTIAFVLRVTAPAYRAAIAGAVGPATAAAQIASSDFAGAAATYAELVARTPDDARLRLSYGQALVAAGQFAAACAEFEKLKGKGLGPRDLGLPAAQACLHAVGADAAIAWLASIPKRFLPARVKDDPAFAPLKDRPEFKALFEP